MYGAWTISSFIPFSYWPAITDGTMDEDLTDLLQEWIDDAPDGSVMRMPAGLYPVAGLRLDGSTGGKSRLHYIGGGDRGTILQKPAKTSLTTAEKRRSCTVSTQGGSRFIFENLRVEGNKSRGGISPPFALPWHTSTAYTVSGSGSVTWSTKADGTEVVPGFRSDLALANGGRMFRIAKNHTSDASNISADIALGNVVEVTDQVWDEMAETGYLGDYEIDDDYANREAFYLHGQASAVTDCLIRNVDVADSVYGSLVIGSGPLFASQEGAGADRITTVNVRSYSGDGGGIGGGNNRSCTHIRPKTYNGRSTGVRFDSGSHDSTVIFPQINDGENLANGGVFVYESNRCKIIRPEVHGVGALAVWIANSVDYEEIVYTPDLNGGSVTITSSSRSATPLPYTGGVA